MSRYAALVVGDLPSRIDVEAVAPAKGDTDRSAAVARLRPRPGRRYATVGELAWRVKRMHLGEVKMRGPNGEVVDVIRYRDKLGYDRRCYRLSRHGVFIGEYKTPEELGKVIDLSELVEDGGQATP